MSSKSGFPSLTALLGLLAIAGYQNRDKIAEMLKGAAGSNAQPGSTAGSPGLGGLLSGVQNLGAGGLLTGGLGELLKKLKQGGMGDVADSWVKPGPNQPATAENLSAALGPEIIQELEQKTGMSRDDIIRRLTRELPEAVDKYTPDGRIPAA